MNKKQAFIERIKDKYNFSGKSIVLGGAMYAKETCENTLISIPLKMMNRHGLIAGATGTGKTKSLQGLAEGLSKSGVPVLLMDVKGDLSGLAVKGKPHPKIEARHRQIGISWEPGYFPVEFLSLSDEKGLRLRATVSEFGPVLMSKILGLNDTQSGILALLFKYCDDESLPLLDIKDLKKALQFISNEGRKEIEAEYGRISTASTGTILRKLIELEQQGAEKFFGEKSFEVEDLLRIDGEGRGMVNILRLTDIQDRPKLFSTFMLQLLAEVYATFPEEGDLEQPKLVIFIDEAHLIFEEASKELLNQLETVVKLIRSKGVGLFFCTQNPTDVPEEILSQLGTKVQHALRAFTAKDRKKIRLVAENFPLTEDYSVEHLLTELGIGEALITVLNEKGVPTPLVATMMCAPASRMDVLTEIEQELILEQSTLIPRYSHTLDRESAFEILSDKIEAFKSAEQQEKLKKQQPKTGRGRSRREKTTIEKITSSSTGKMIVRELTRGLLGVLGLGGKRRR